VGLLGAPSLWLEIGSYVGATAILTSAALKAVGLPPAIVCIDPFTGGVDEWAGRDRGLHIGGGLRMDVFGHTRLYETFLANVNSAGHRGEVMPLRVSPISGLRTLQQLYQEQRLSQPTSVVFLGGRAHEEAETLLEVRLSWGLLASPGMLMGELWPERPGVWGDVRAFARELRLPRLPGEMLQKLEAATHCVSEPEPGLALLLPSPGGAGLWLLPKGEWTV